IAGRLARASALFRYTTLFRSNGGASGCLAIAVVHNPHYCSNTFWKYFTRKGSCSVKVIGNSSACTVIGKRSVKFGTYYRVLAKSKVGIACAIGHASDYWGLGIINGYVKAAANSISAGVSHFKSIGCCPYREYTSAWQTCCLIQNKCLNFSS